MKRLDDKQLVTQSLDGDTDAFGELVNELLLASQRAVPQRLDETGYKFAHPDLEEALRHQLGC